MKLGFVTSVWGETKNYPESFLVGWNFFPKKTTLIDFKVHENRGFEAS